MENYSDSYTKKTQIKIKMNAKDALKPFVPLNNIEFLLIHLAFMKHV